MSANKDLLATLEDPSAGLTFDGPTLVRIFAGALTQDDWPGAMSIRHLFRCFLDKFSAEERQAFYLDFLRMVRSGALEKNEEALQAVFIMYLQEKGADLKALLPEVDLLLHFTGPSYSQQVRFHAVSLLAQSGYIPPEGWEQYPHEDGVLAAINFLGIHNHQCLAKAVEWLISQSENVWADTVLLRSYPSLRRLYPDEALDQLVRYAEHVRSLSGGEHRANMFRIEIEIAKTRTEIKS